MKKFKIFFISFFVLCFVCVCLIFQTFLLSQSLKTCESITIEKSNFKKVKTLNEETLHTLQNDKPNYEYIIKNEEKIYKFKDGDFKLNLTKLQQKNHHSLSVLKSLGKLNLSAEEKLTYVFPEIKIIFDRLSKNINIDETEDKVFVIPNACKLEYLSGERGRNINKIKFFADFLKQIEENKTQLKINIEILDYKNKDNAKKLFAEKSCFSTNFSTSSPERKNNIQVALRSLDGLVVDEGEVFSFNAATGVRDESSGYKQAKIISNGTFVLGFGGGVCQVSTTLYNACLLSGLDILEACNHSLPVSYIEPSFDAMVSIGSSDLKFRNNTGGKIIITTSSKNDICKIKIFGIKNKYKITRQSEKVSIIPAEPDVIETDYLKYGCYDLEVGESKRLSYPKDGFISRGYLNFYDTNGKLVERKKIRENRYNPTRGIIIKREN